MVVVGVLELVLYVGNVAVNVLGVDVEAERADGVLGLDLFGIELDADGISELGDVFGPCELAGEVDGFVRPHLTEGHMADLAYCCGHILPPYSEMRLV